MAFSSDPHRSSEILNAAHPLSSQPLEQQQPHPRLHVQSQHAHQLPKFSHSTTTNMNGNGGTGAPSNGYMMVTGSDIPSHVNGDRERENGRVSGHQQQPHQPYPTNGPSHPTTAISRQNSSSSTASSVAPPGESSAELLRQTLSGSSVHTAPNTRSHSRSSSRRRQPRTPNTPRSGMLTPATFHGSPGDSGTESLNEDIADHEFEGMRHGFEDEYNSEAYLAVLEQVGASCLLGCRNLNFRDNRFFICTTPINATKPEANPRRKHFHSKNGVCVIV